MPDTVKKISTPFADATVRSLKAGDQVLISGVVYAARDAVHKRLLALIKEGKELPLDLHGAVIYYVGPTPAKAGQASGSAGPTTSSRMDGSAPYLLGLGLKGMIGKGLRSAEVVEAMKRNTAVYFAAIGGAGALLAKCIKKVTIIAYDELGAESLKKMEVVDFPAIVAIDCQGANLYEQGKAKYRLDA